MWTYTYTDELYHHGVKGMKWGVRKKRAQSSGDSRTKRMIKGVANEFKNPRKIEERPTGARLPKYGRGQDFNPNVNRKPPKGAIVNYASTKQPKLPKYGKGQDFNPNVNRKPPKNAIQEKPRKGIDSKKVRNAAADALDELETKIFFKGDKIPNNTAIRYGLDAVSRGLRNGSSFKDTAVEALDNYRFFKDK